MYSGAALMASRVWLTKTFESAQLTRSIHLWRDQNFLAGPPVPRIDNQVTNRLRVVINDEILNVTDTIVQSLDGIASDLFHAAEMRIVACRAAHILGPANRFAPGKGIRAPCVRPHPVPWPVVIGIVVPLILPRDWSIGLDGRTVLNLLFSKGNRDHLIVVVGFVQYVRRNENLAPAQPTPVSTIRYRTVQLWSSK